MEALPQNLELLGATVSDKEVADPTVAPQGVLGGRLGKVGVIAASLSAVVGTAGAGFAVWSRGQHRGPVLRTLSFGEKATLCSDGQPGTAVGLPPCCPSGAVGGVYKVKQEFEHGSTCGHVECGTGRFVGSECTRRLTDGLAIATLHSVMTARNETKSGRVLQAAPLNGKGNDVEFPEAQDMTATAALVTTASPDVEKRETQQGQAYCAGDISGATLYSAGIGLQIAAAVFYCAKEVTEEAPQKCSRQIFAVIEDMALTAKYGIEAADDCSADADPCGVAVDDMLARTFDMGVAASRMETDCQRFIYAPGTINHFSCGGDLQKLASNFPDFIGDITEGMRQCNSHPQDGFLQDYGLCVGGVLSVCGYIAGAALQLEYIPRSCGNPKTDKEKGPECSTTVASSLQSLSVAASATVDAASSCGGIDTDCGIDLADLASSLFNVQSGFSNVATFCSPDDLYRNEDDVGGLQEIVDASCADAITTGIQGLTVIASTALDAANSCAPGNDNEDNNECGSGISSALASFSFLAGQLSQAFMNCRHGALEFYGFYKCAANFERIADIASTTSESIGDAVAHCGIQKASEVAKQIPLQPVQLPRRFYRNTR